MQYDCLRAAAANTEGWQILMSGWPTTRTLLNTGLRSPRGPESLGRVLSFYTATLDVRDEPRNEVNPIPGRSLLLWLLNYADHAVKISVPAPEDWGWYSYAEWNGGEYLLGASGSSERADGQREWILHIDKRRSLREKLLAKTKMTQDDGCARFFQSVLEREASFPPVSVI